MQFQGRIVEKMTDSPALTSPRFLPDTTPSSLKLVRTHPDSPIRALNARAARESRKGRETSEPTLALVSACYPEMDLRRVVVRPEEPRQVSNSYR
jgi:hypothetical protein